MTSDAARACSDSFSRVVCSCTTSSRAAGSRSRIGSATKIVAIRLPSSSSSSGCRMLTGTRATRCSGSSSPRRSKKRPSPPATAARTTSLTVAPPSPRAPFRRSRRVARNATRRSRPISWLRKVGGHARPARGQPREALGGAPQAAGRLARHRQRRKGRLARRACRLANPVGRGADEQHLGARLVGLPGLRRQLHLGALRVRVDEERADVERRDPVDESVVGLRDDRVAAALEPLDQVDAPERPVEVERLREDLADEVAELRHRARPGQRHVLHVPAEVEARVVAPLGVREAERHPRHALAKARDEVEPRVDVLEQRVVAGGLALDDHRAADVDVDRARARPGARTCPTPTGAAGARSRVRRAYSRPTNESADPDGGPGGRVARGLRSSARGPGGGDRAPARGRPLRPRPADHHRRGAGAAAGRDRARVRRRGRRGGR